MLFHYGREQMPEWWQDIRQAEKRRIVREDAEWMNCG